MLASLACPAQVEQHMVGGEEKTLLVHRKGSTRAFPPHHPLIPVDYQLTGQPVLIGGTMGTHSYVLTGALGLRLLRSVWPAPQRTPCARLAVLIKHLGGKSTVLSPARTYIHTGWPRPYKLCCVQAQRRAWQRPSAARAMGLAAPPAATAPEGTSTTRRCAALGTCTCTCLAPHSQ